MTIRALLQAALCLLLITTSGTLAAVNAGHGGDHAVICAGGTSVMVQIGPDGQPVEIEMVCPDCLLAAADLPNAILSGLLAPNVITTLVAWPVVVGTPSQTTASAFARGPPKMSTL
ncbi:hypothetical protein [Litoreibacter roseus]|uniref:DUF2946 family protein n=1 Tax=Litoreibacter roseus TaxID=2601869 RepID=A0A6N6JB61_9RHOB|nr:hypothetical protein [Litoreibacter roseus]GFE63471.1 hypothetical protein KIN_05450 [Litoreibacter roseus]